MAQRPAWTIKDDLIKCEYFEFQWNGGFALIQKQKNINNLHKAIYNKYGEKSLEVSTKSDLQLGKEASAFNLKCNGYFVENIFQSSKVYSEGGPFIDLLNKSPKEAKKDERHLKYGALKEFFYNDVHWELTPRTAFYDYLYINALLQSTSMEFLECYQWFTDIEFNPKRSINCQARSIAIAKYLFENNKMDKLNNVKAWVQFHREHVKD
ncbi:MAG: hypothetical protein LKH93_00760 [Clostridium beijerinckii]|jgi:hypothetical protein|nr:hypothetical protein [Clostridium beijerinckii]MCI1577865.1 hypothetical protein [Clostridium beijerinckii]MCI1583577.1 hypothetical protein [Clostridium beijerinckii]MCI1620724.1 hypothetical protein [Clostridium beijerinckii]